MRLLERLVLEEHGLDCVEARNGEEALERCRTGERFAAVVLDHRMPGLTGLEVAEVLRAEGYDGPIVLYTGFAQSQVEERAAPLNLDLVDKAEPERMAAAVRRHAGLTPA